MILLKNLAKASMTSIEPYVGPLACKSAVRDFPRTFSYAQAELDWDLPISMSVRASF
jgi:hypothetical protein